MRDGVATAGADLGGRSLDERWSSSLLRMGDISDSMDGTFGEYLTLIFIKQLLSIN